MAASDEITRLVIGLFLAAVQALPLVWLFPHRRRSPAAPWTIVYCVLVSVGGICHVVADAAMLGRAAWPVYLEAAGVAADLLAVSLLIRIVSLFLDWPLAGRWGWVSLGASVCAGCVCAVLLLSGYSAPWVLWPARATWAANWVALIAVTVRRYRRVPTAFHRNRVLTCIVFFTPLLLGQGVTALTSGWLLVCGAVLHLLGSAGLVWALLNPDLPSVYTTFRRVLGFAVLVLATTALYLAGTFGAQQLAHFLSFPQSALLWSVLSGLVLAGLYRPLYVSLSRWADRVPGRAVFDPARTLRDYSQAISGILDLEQLEALAIGTVSEILEVSRGALLVATRVPDGYYLALIRGMGLSGLQSQFFEGDSAIVRRWGRGEAILYHHLDQEAELLRAPEAERTWLAASTLEVFLPVLAREDLLGVLALGEQRNNEPYGSREIAFLSTMAQQTAVALQNAALVDSLRRLSRDLQAAKERLERLDAAKTDFLTVASHELRTPLTQIKGYASLLAEMAQERSIRLAEVISMTGSIDRATVRLEAVVDAITAASQIETNALDLQIAQTTLKEILELSIQPWVDTIVERKLRLQVRGVDGLPPVRSDLPRMCQALSNVINNAVKFTPDGKDILVTAYVVNEQWYELIIADTGVGIDEQDQELIFEKFSHVGSVEHHSTSSSKFKGGGPGLGLAIAKGIIEAHGGRIWVNSSGRDEARGPGSAFHVRLPFDPSRALPG